VRKYFGHATPYQVKRMFQLFYPGEELASEFAKALCAKVSSASTAQLQSYFMLFKDTPRDALENIPKFKELTAMDHHPTRLPAIAADTADGE